MSHVPRRELRISRTLFNKSKAACGNRASTSPRRTDLALSARGRNCSHLCRWLQPFGRIGVNHQVCGLSGHSRVDNSISLRRFGIRKSPTSGRSVSLSGNQGAAFGSPPSICASIRCFVHRSSSARQMTLGAVGFTNRRTSTWRAGI